MPATGTADGPTSSGTPAANSGSSGGGEKPKDESPPPESPRAREPNQDEDEAGPSEVKRPTRRRLNTVNKTLDKLPAEELIELLERKLASLQDEPEVVDLRTEVTNDYQHSDSYS